MHLSRRNLLKSLPLGAGASLLGPMANRILANAEGKRQAPRFVFVIQSNGFDAVQACPESIPFQKYADRETHEEHDLTQHKLPKGLAPLEPFKARTTILQGLSGRCTGGGHSTHGGCLGLYRTTGANASPQSITIDYQLGKTAPAILPWIGVGMSVGGVVGGLLSATAPTRKLLERVLPDPGTGPSPAAQEKGFFDVRFVAEGPAGTDRTLRTRVLGDRDPGYGATSRMLGETALALAAGEATLGGGHWTPGAALGDSLLRRLPANAGVTFSVLD